MPTAPAELLKPKLDARRAEIRASARMLAKEHAPPRSVAQLWYELSERGMIKFCNRIRAALVNRFQWAESRAIALEDVEILDCLIEELPRQRGAIILRHRPDPRPDPLDVRDED